MQFCAQKKTKQHRRNEWPKNIEFIKSWMTWGFLSHLFFFFSFLLLLYIVWSSKCPTQDIKCGFLVFCTLFIVLFGFMCVCVWVSLNWQQQQIDTYSVHCIHYSNGYARKIYNESLLKSNVKQKRMFWCVFYILCMHTLMAYEYDEHAHPHSNKLKQLTHVRSTEIVSIQS